MNEDDRYRTSSQYRYWSYTPASLAALRATTNQLAAERVRAAVARVRASRAASASASGETSEVDQFGTPGSNAAVIPEGEVDCLTPEEELKLVKFYCRQTIQLGDHLNLPSTVKVNQYLCHRTSQFQLC
jgi:cyclin H